MGVGSVGGAPSPDMGGISSEALGHITDAVNSATEALSSISGGDAGSPFEFAPEASSSCSECGASGAEEAGGPGQPEGAEGGKPEGAGGQEDMMMKILMMLMMIMEMMMGGGDKSGEQAESPAK